MENNERLAAGRRNSPVGGLQAALGQSRSPRSIAEVSQLQSSSGQPSTATLPIIPESAPDPVQMLQPTLQTSQLVATSSGGHPKTLQAAAVVGPIGTCPIISLPGLSSSQLPPQPYVLSVPAQPWHEQCLTEAGTLPPNATGGGGDALPLADGASQSSLFPIRGSLAKGAAMATATRGPPLPGLASVSVNGEAAATGGVPLSSGRGRGHGTQYSNSGAGSPVLAGPPAITPLSSSLSHGFRQGLPSWLQDPTPQPPQPQPHLQYPQTQVRLQPQTQTEPHLKLQHPQLHKRSPFLPTPQAPRRPPDTALIDAAGAALQLHPAWALYSGDSGVMAQDVAPYPAVSRPLPTAATAGHGHNLATSGLTGAGPEMGPGHGPGPAPGPRIAPFRQDSSDELPLFGDTLPRGPALTRGRSGIPRVASISEIEPVVESEEPPRSQVSNSLLTRAISIPNAQGLSQGLRTYRVALAKSQGSQDDVTVVLEGAEKSSGGARGGRGGAGGSSLHGSHQSYGSSGGAGAGSSVLGAAGMLSTSLRGSSFLGGLFGSRAAGTGSVMLGRGALGLVSPERSVQEMDMLPFAGRERYYHPNNELPTTTFGSLPASSLLRSRANASAGSILSKATGGLKTANTKALKRSVSYQQFNTAALAAGSSSTGGGGGHNAADRPSSFSGARRHGRRPARTSVNGGSDSSGACTSTSASQRGGLTFWLRGGGGDVGSAGDGGAGCGRGGAGGGAGSDSDGAVFGAVPAARPRAEPDLADLAVLATSLPASLGTWSLPRSVALASSPTTVGGGSVRGGSALYGGSSSVRGGRAFYGVHGNLPSRTDSVNNGMNNAGGSIATAVVGGAPAVSGPAGGFPICLICLEVLVPEEFERGDAISLQCACKGEVSLRHRKCAIEWSHHKGDVICDICKQVIANLPPIPPEVLAAREAARRRRQPAFNTAAEPNFADFCFDCIRATWVTMIVCVLFFDVSIGQAFMFGSLVGLAFMLVSMVIAACARRARALAAARAVERAAAESRAQEQQMLLQQGQQQQHRWQQQQPQQIHTSGSEGGTGAGVSGWGTGPSRGFGGGGGGGGGGGSLRGLSAVEPALTVPLLAAGDEV